MLPVAEIHRISRTVDDQWRSAVADAVAERWGVPSGAARWLRSSGTHVFVVRSPDGVPPMFLRFAPAASPAGRRLAASAELMTTWAGRGIRVVEPLRSLTGARTEQVTTAVGPFQAMLVPAADGDELSVEDLTEDRAAEWGAALGALHRDGSIGVNVQVATDALDAREVPGLDPELAEAARALQAALRRLDPRLHSRGICHGDFELDNLRFGPGGPTFFDSDEATVSWFAADVAMAVRDLTGVTLDSEPQEGPLHSFLTGYRTQRTFTAEEEASLPLHSVAASLRLVVDIDGALADDGDTLPELRTQLLRHRDWHRGRVLEWTA
jgi:Ser/Thr protein kinase RdoA (MazF antagonist)